MRIHKVREDEFLTTGEIAKILKITTQSVVNEIKRGNLVGLKIGSQYRVRSTDFNEYLIQSRV